MGKIIGLFGVVIILVLLLLFVAYKESKSKDILENQEKQDKKQRIQGLIDTLKLELIKLKYEKEEGKKDAMAKYVQCVEDLNQAEQMLEKYK